MGPDCNSGDWLQISLTMHDGKILAVPSHFKIWMKNDRLRPSVSSAVASERKEVAG
jgi:hypothetical protein